MMFNDAQQQYYLNAMGMSKWYLKDSELDLSHNYVPSGLYPYQQDAKQQPQLQEQLIEVRDLSVAITDKASTADKVSTTDKVPTEKVPLPEDIATDTLQSLGIAISSCKNCSSRIFGEKSLKVQLLKKSVNSSKKILLVVESPSIDQFQQSSYITSLYYPLLHAIFRAVNLDANIYISSILKCLESDPYKITEDETYSQQVNVCLDFFKQELELLKVDLVVALGPVSLNILAENITKNRPLAESSAQQFMLKKSLFSKKTIPLITTFHPSFLYRNPLFKSKALSHWINIAEKIQA